MKTIMSAKSSHDSSFSFSRRYFHWKRKPMEEDDDDEEEEEILNNISSSSSHYFCDDDDDDDEKEEEYHHNINLPPELSSTLAPAEKKKKKKKHHSNKSSKLKSALTVFTKSRSLHNSGLGTRVVGTLFGYRRGHVHFAFQEDPKLSPAFLIELATPTSVLVKEMASGLVRIALECEKKEARGSNNNNNNSNSNSNKGMNKLLDEPIWRTYCNGRKCGYANRRECGPEEWKILKAVEPISMGAGVLPVQCGGNGAGSEGELMYMRAKYERVVGSKDSEAFYMMNPDGTGGPELSIYLLRV